jgi:xanthine/uracil permease
MRDEPSSNEGQDLPTDSPPSYTSRREERLERRRRRRMERTTRYGGGWIAGVVLILLGVIVLLQNLGAAMPTNWWALFILIPAIGAFARAWSAYQNNAGGLNAVASGSLIGGLVLTLVALMFLFNLNWGVLGPVVLIILGLGALLSALLPTK